MECLWDADLLRRGGQLPEELLHIIQLGSNEQYLEALTKTALDARYTYILLTHCEDVFAHICASLRRHGSFASSIATLGRIIPYASFLSPLATQLLEHEKYSLGRKDADSEDLLYLLGLFRLVKFDRRTFGRYIATTELSSLLRKSSPAVTYLIIRILQIQLSGADHWFEVTLKQYLGEDRPDAALDGSWDERTIDYRFLTLWEQERSDKVVAAIAEAHNATISTQLSKARHISAESFHPATSLIGRVLLPTLSDRHPDAGMSELVHTLTTLENVASISNALKRPDPLLLTGLAGSGKSLLVRHVAKALGKLDRMITLHLNEQSDAKILLGLHTTGDVPGTFTWKPGVLTTAVQEGRWVLIEDLDKAPNEVLGTLLPLIGKRELLLPNRKETIYAAPGFRIVATVRSFRNHRGEESKPLSHMVGARHWRKISIKMPEPSEVADVVRSLYPGLDKLIAQFMAVYGRLNASSQQSILVGQSKTGVARIIGLRDLLKWCKRVASSRHGRSSFTSKDIDDSFLEAIDCFVGALPDDEVRTMLATHIAEELHINPQRRDHLLREREPEYKATKESIRAGRHSIPRSMQKKLIASTFSTNPHTCRTLESVLAAVVNREPLLLVGETGVGKTTAVQHLATQLGKKLVPFNLSQQTEVGDLLGGFKPVNPRALMVPLKDEFDELFSDSFPSAKNEKFIALLKKSIDRNNWAGVCKLFRTAVGMVNQERAATPPREEGEAPAKKRKTGSRRAIDFAKWDAFFLKLEAMEQRLRSGDKAMAFTFVEGNIVKAVRNGDWVLLDEINLASSDTLESIVDLLDSAPSLLLTESGNIERVEAHPDFRVFAAMNPATDVGKKDLPPGVRSRFTELYVESPDKDAKSLESIVRSWLGPAATSDLAVASHVRGLYQKIITLSHDNKLVDGACQKPHFSLRTLTRTLSYAKHISQMCSLRRALYEGFQMSFLTSLDAESISLVQPLIEDCLFRKAKINVKAELQRALRKPEDGHGYVQGHPGSKHWIRKGAGELQDQPQYIITDFVRRNLENLVRAASTRQFPVLIQGPTSAGKTSMIEHLAQRTGHKFTRINNHEHTDLQEYLGTYVSGTDGTLQFQEGMLVKALREGHWLVLDELNLAPTDVLEALNRLLDDNRELLVPETQETIRPHPDFMLFATQNPAGLYGGRKALSRAFRNRFLELHFDDIPISELQEILQRRTQQPASRCARIVNVYRELSVMRQESRLFEQKSFATLRDLFRWAMRPNDTIEQLAANGYMLLCERVRKPEERVALKAIIEKAMSEKGPKVRIDEDTLYAQNAPEILQHAQSGADHGLVWTKAMRRLYVLVFRALANNEPVLLVGETGCGKTTVCQMLADAMNKVLYTVNAHQNTETGDLIGSQRPVRNRSAIESALRQKLIASPILRTFENAVSRSTDELLATYNGILKALPKHERTTWHQDPIHLEIQLCRTRYNALFEWADGTLVKAMREGQLFLLDEISLADDSVLERINSVLESSRTILLAEKGSLDASVTAAPGFQFFATMNPGGDYGKRELSPALRNRFTEIWVPAMSDLDDVLQIVQAKLVAAAQLHARAMIYFASWFKKRFDTSASSAVSIRDTLAWTQFINSFEHAGTMPAIVHGAAMVYIDTLGANPAGLMSTTSLSLDEERRACFAELGRLLGIDAFASYSGAFEVHLDPTTFGIGPFQIERTTSIVEGEVTFTFDPPTTRSNAMRILRALQLSKPVLLEGSPGVGKTALVTAIAAATGTPLTRINLSDQTDLIDLFGADAPVEDGFGWRDAPFLRAMKSGEWVLLDEMNLASQSVLEGLNACLDHRGEVFVPELGLSFARHPRFRLFAAQNPHHQGGGRKGLPASFVNRFTVVYADTFKADDLLTICQRSFSELDGDYVKRSIEFVTRLNTEVADRRSFGALGSPWEFNLRDITRWFALAASRDGLLRAGTPRDFVEMLFTERFRTPFDKHCVRELFTSIFGGAQHSTDLFYNLSTQTLQIGLALLPRDTLSTALPNQNLALRASSQHLRALQSIMLCVHKRWPVILAGGPGVGKTALLERLAACVGANVVTLGMSAEADTLDLIGGYEQHDPHRRRVLALKRLRAHRELLGKTALEQGHVIDYAALEQAFLAVEQTADDVSISRLTKLLPRQVAFGLSPVLEQLRAGSEHIDKARFEWIEGPLIEAIQEGKWVVLDNANLCSPSVLDRLNGLMEPNGVLIVNEHSAPNGSAQIIKPHPGFRIFLIVDPKLGELSRAMRNRAVEIYLGDLQTDAVASTTMLHPESSMTRFGALRQVTAVVRDEFINHVARDHCGLADEKLMVRFEHDTAWDDQSCDATKASPSSSQVGVQTLYQGVTNALQAPADYARVQVSSPMSLITVHPLNNQPLVQQSQQVYTTAMLFAARYDINVQLTAVMTKLAASKADRKLVDRLARFWQSARQQTKFGSAKTRVSLLDVCNKLLLSLQEWSQQSHSMPSDDLRTIKNALMSLIAYCWNLLRELGSPMLDVPMLTAIAMVGQSICHQMQSLPALEQTVSRFQSGLGDLGLVPNAEARHAFIAMWQQFRPAMPKTMETLQALLCFEDVMGKFDEAALSFRVPVKHIAELRVHFQQALNFSHSAEDLRSLADKALSSLPASTLDDELIDNAVAVKPHFVASFESLYQRQVIASAEYSSTPIDVAKLEVLAMRKTGRGLSGVATSTPGRSTLDHIRSISSGPSTGGMSITNAVQSFESRRTILGDLTTAKEVSLQALNLLESEVKILGHTTTSRASLLEDEAVRHLDTKLRSLLESVAQALAQQSELGLLKDHAARILRNENTNEAAIHAVAGCDDKRAAAVCRRLTGVKGFLEQSCEQRAGRQHAAAYAWASLATACLDLCLPEHTFDPVQEGQVSINIFQHTKDNLQTQLKALRSYRQAWVGESDSLRTRLLEEEVAALGEGPAVVEICRPEVSQLSQLQGDLQALSRLISPLRQDPTPANLNDAGWDNLSVIRNRLATQYRPYADLTTPVLGFVDCLSVARRVSLSPIREAQTRNPIAKIVPFLDAGIDDWTNESLFVHAQDVCRSKEEQLLWLSVIAARCSVVPIEQTSRELRATVNYALRLFYEAWAKELDRDQRLAARNSSLYQFRGTDDESEEAVKAELNALFPTYGEDMQEAKEATGVNAQALAPAIYAIHHSIHSQKALSHDVLLDLLRRAYGVPALRDDPSVVAIIDSLYKLSTELSAPKVSRNIYTDPDVGQAKRLAALLDKIQKRFEYIHSAWPDHATPIEALRACNTILAIHHSEPLARFLPYIEKLHVIVNEWQKVASSEYSVSSLLEEITSLVVSWRQLELSTWAGLFDHEDKACEKSASTWWYVAYETIVIAAESEAQTGAALHTFSQQLLETLSSFLQHCGLGEFAIRLSMLADFEADLRVRFTDNPALRPVHVALASLVQFYSHFTASVSSHLATKRGELEKQIKEVVQLASWKDRNIEALKRSAKNSHNRLLRSVKKYRMLLAEPVAPLLQSEFPPMSQHQQQEPERNAKAIDHPGSAAVQLEAWLGRPKALSDLALVAREIASRSEKVKAALKVTKRLESFWQATNEEAAELRKATPSVATEKNKGIVQQLKTRKRRLLADVFREVQAMGFQRNMAEDTLAQQQSLQSVLSRSMPLQSIRPTESVVLADYEHHRFLHLMPTVRESTVKHNEDLTPAEIARGKTLLESMLHITVQQRISISNGLGNLEAFASAVRLLREVSELGNAHVESGVVSDLKLCAANIRGLLAVLQAASRIVHMQAHLANTDYSEVEAQLAANVQDLQALEKTISSHAALPIGISARAPRDVVQQYEVVCSQLRTHVSGAIMQHQELHPILKHVARWTATQQTYESVSHATSTSANDWVHMLLSLVNDMEAPLTANGVVGANGTTQKPWLLDQQQHLQSFIQAMNLDAARSKMDNLIPLLPSLRFNTSKESLVKQDLDQIAGVCAHVLPVLDAYVNSASSILLELCAIHTTTSRVAFHLATSFVQLARQGFCTPSDKAQGEEQQSGQVESGTGLGDGEGGEDISKDVGANEDLSELAQEAKSKDKDEEIEAEKDAVDMADEDLQGDFDEGNGSEQDEQQDEQEGEDDADLDEETGKIGENDDAVDEKSWDDGKKAEEADMEAEKGKGTRNDDQAAAENAEASDAQEGEQMEEETEAGAEMDPQAGQNDPDQADPHMQDEQNLELPEDLQMDGDRDEMSDIEAEDDMPDDMDDAGYTEEEATTKEDPDDLDADMAEGEGDEQAEKTGEATAAEEEVPDQEKEEGDDGNSDMAMLDNEDTQEKPDDGVTSADAGQGQEEDVEDAKKTGAVSSAEQQEDDHDANEPSEQTGATEGTQRTQTDLTSGQAETGDEQQQPLPFKQLGDVLKQWYNQNRNIEAAQEPQESQKAAEEELDKSDPRFEHLPENVDSDMQALGAASAEQSKALDDQNAIDVNEQTLDDVPLPEEQVELPEDNEPQEETEASAAKADKMDGGSRPNQTMVGKPKDLDTPMDDYADLDEPDDIENVDEQLDQTHLSQDKSVLKSIDDARKEWNDHEKRTRNMAIVLTEHLRLILQPTQATKMRGDFRTGKRLNIKKIIPYIASSYKRDKIWMRRSVPSKRTYHIMLAIDDSQSMDEDERKGLAFDTLALIAKSMAMLEVGELSVLGFGETATVAHAFDMPFTSDAGAEVIRQLTFSQTKTDIKRLLEKSIELFRSARLKATGSSSNLWQLQLIISDGLCEDHPSIRQLVRQAHEEHIMVVFIVVDAAAQETTAVGSKKQSILDLNRVEFAMDANGESQVNMVKYLDTFPFRYYLIVRDVLELPNVLAGALRQWFAEVVGSDG
ncbi:Midasin [Cercospora zeina]